MSLKSMNVLLCAVLLAPWSWTVAAAPDIVLKDFQGRAVNVNRYIGHGKWTVVVAWAHDCHVCNQEMHHMAFFHDAHKARDATVLGVSVDGFAGLAQAAAFVERHGLDFPNLLAEPHQEVMMKFGAGPFAGTPTYYIFGPDGVLRASQAGAVTQDDIEAFLDAQRGARPAESATARPRH